MPGGFSDDWIASLKAGDEEKIMLRTSDYSESRKRGRPFVILPTTAGAIDRQSKVHRCHIDLPR